MKRFLRRFFAGLLFFAAALPMGLTPCARAEETDNLTCTVTAAPGSLSEAGDALLTLTVENGGGSALRDVTALLPDGGKVRLTDPWDGTSAGAVLAPGATVTVTASAYFRAEELGYPQPVSILAYRVSEGLSPAEATLAASEALYRVQTQTAITVDRAESGSSTLNDVLPQTSPAEPAISVSVEPGRTVARTDEDVPFTISVTNTGNATLTGVVGEVNGKTYPMGMLLPGVTRRATDSFFMEMNTVLTAAVSYTCEKQTYHAEAAPVTVRLQDSRMTLGLSTSVGSPAQGEAVPVSVSITNSGVDTLTGLELRDRLGDLVPLPTTELASGESMQLSVVERFDRNTDLFYTVSAKSASGSVSGGASGVIPVVLQADPSLSPAPTEAPKPTLTPEERQNATWFGSFTMQTILLASAFVLIALVLALLFTRMAKRKK